MEKVREVKRAIHYLENIANELAVTGTDDSRILCSELYQNYTDAKAYLKIFSANEPEIAKLVDELPNLVRDSIFNTQFNRMWILFAIPGCLNPFITIIIIGLTFPISLPYLVIRGFIRVKTKSRIAEGKFKIIQVINKPGNQ